MAQCIVCTMQWFDNDVGSIGLNNIYVLLWQIQMLPAYTVLYSVHTYVCKHHVRSMKNIVVNYVILL